MRKAIEKAALAGAVVALLGLLAAVVGVLGGAASAAPSTAPGKNGRIAFRRYLGPNMKRGTIFTIGADRRHEQQVTRPHAAEDDQPDWSPDGSSLVFSRSKHGGPGAIYTVRADGSGLKRLSPTCRAGAKCEDDFLPTFSPDGRHVAFASFSGKVGASIVIVGRNGRNRRIVVRGTKRAAMGDPQFSPNDAKIAFVRTPEPGERTHAIFVADTDGTGMHQVTPWRLAGGDNPDWSPDGKWILFRSNVDANKQSQIYRIHPDGTGLEQLTQFKRGTIVTSSSFSPDGKWIVLGASGVGGNADLFVMPVNGGSMRPLTRTRLWDSAPDWGPAPSAS